MANESDLSSTAATDREMLERLGRRLAALRKRSRLTQGEAAERAAVNRETVSRAETGGNVTLETLVRLLRAYGEAGALDDFLRPPEVSPMALVAAERRGRKGRSG